jgi:hypothetical protein
MESPLVWQTWPWRRSPSEVVAKVIGIEFVEACRVEVELIATQRFS